MPKKKQPLTNPIHKQYDELQEDLARVIDKVSHLYQEERVQQGLIAQWGLSYSMEDLIKIYHRIGNLKHTIRKGKKK